MHDIEQLPELTEDEKEDAAKKPPPLQYLFFDTETNGLPYNYRASIADSDNWPRLLQLAWKLQENWSSHYPHAEDLEVGNYLINHGEDFELDPGAAAIHGLTLAKLAQQGRALETVLFEFHIALEKCDAIVAHNLDFDFAIIGAELLRANMDQTLALLKSKRKICTMKQSTDFCALPGGRRGYKWPNLAELYLKLFGSAFYGAHDAMNDVNALSRCFWELKWRQVIEKEAAR